MADRRAKGLCFRCDERFAPGHRCKEKSLHVIVVGDPEKGVEQTEESEMPEEDDDHIHLDTLEVSYRDRERVTPPTTMKMAGIISGLGVVVLIDSGATHSFIAREVVERLRMEVRKTEAFSIILGDGRMERGGGICRGVTLTLQALRIVQDFLPMELGDMDVILGIQWLRTIGVTRMDWNELTMELQVEGRRVILCGDFRLQETWVPKQGKILHLDETTRVIHRMSTPHLIPSTQNLGRALKRKGMEEKARFHPPTSAMGGTCPECSDRERTSYTRDYQEGACLSYSPRSKSPSKVGRKTKNENGPKGKHSVWSRLGQPTEEGEKTREKRHNNLEDKVEFKGAELIRVLRAGPADPLGWPRKRDERVPNPLVRALSPRQIRKKPRGAPLGRKWAPENSNFGGKGSTGGG